jgi:hypothetical protein
MDANLHCLITLIHDELLKAIIITASSSDTLQTQSTTRLEFISSRGCDEEKSLRPNPTLQLSARP